MTLSALSVTAGAAAAYFLFILVRFIRKRQPGDFISTVYPGPLVLIVAPFWPMKGWIGNFWSEWIPYERAGQTIMPLIWPLGGKRWFFVADATAINIAFNDRHTFVKNTAGYDLISFFGQNIVGTEGDDWVRHRSITRKSFGERNNALLWSETVFTLNEWFSEWDLNISQQTRTVVNITETMRDVTLFVIASAGFGMHFQRSLHGVAVPPGYTMSFGESLFTAIETMAIKVIAPRWLYALPLRKLRHSDTAYNELQRYIKDMIYAARQGKKAESMGVDDQKVASSESADLFRRLIEANEEETGSARLSEDELVSNIYTFFLAGHETSAHTLTFAFALLAIHPKIQDKVYQEASRLWPDLNSDGYTGSSLADYNELEYTLAVFRETVRQYPPVVRTMRYASVDTSLPCEVLNKTTGQWEPSRVPIHAGAGVALNMHAAHMCPRYWGNDVKAFRPERFIDTETYQWPRDAWIPFTTGPHVCLGQRFAMVESVCILARILRKYRISPTPEISKLPHAVQWERLTKWTVGVTATPGRVDLVFESR